MSLIHPKFTVIGADVSHWQGPIDWAIAGSKLSFAIIRSGDGSGGGNLDSRWQYNWQNARGKLARGAYWFYRSNVDPIQQVEWIEKAYRQVGGDYGELGFFIDLENDKGNVNQVNYTAGLVKFLDAMDEILKTNSPKVPLSGIYTSYGWWDVKVNPHQIEKLNQRALWPAQWFYTATPGPRRLPYGWDAWTIWQLTAKGDGRSYLGPRSGRDLDLDVFNGDYSEFVQRFSIGNLPPPPIDNRVVVGFRPARSGMNVRNKPTTVGSAILLKTTTEVLPVLKSTKDERGDIWYLIGGNDETPLWISSTVGEPVYG